MKAISSMATRHVLADLARAATKAGLPRVDLLSAGGVDAARRVAAGEPVDLVFLARKALDTLADEGHVRRETVTDLVVSSVAAALPDAGENSAVCPSGAAFDDATEMQAALTAAERIGYSTGPSGTSLLAMISGWGMSDEIGPKLVQAPPGIPVATLLARREVDLGLQQLSELVGQPGVRIMGVLPADCAIDTVFAGAVARRALGSDEARAVLAFFGSPGVHEITRSHSFQPV
ncbi:molybdate transport system substrate-binding protein [Microbacterium foliorum]|uniref:Molybdate transport system substrate-binding protein n=1 Tax=Microbacterium foliorum TaxID=104336 RepID=A0ABU1HVL1_9MICO|nr:substrate-binding domain-containing protein [Microbacterium foliorum]MDR6144093.1 molybdate transport system substrate-binding protein [Microbacterium foliorum]